MSDYPKLTGKTIKSIELLYAGPPDQEYLMTFTDGTSCIISANGAAYCSAFLDITDPA